MQVDINRVAASAATRADTVEDMVAAVVVASEARPATLAADTDTCLVTAPRAKSAITAARYVLSLNSK